MKIPAGLKKAALSFSLALAFLLAQFGFAQHSVAHLSDYHLHQQDKHSGQSNSCDTCQGYAGFSSSIPSCNIDVLISETIGFIIGQEIAAFSSGKLLSFYSRAPPQI